MSDIRINERIGEFDARITNVEKRLDTQDEGMKQIGDKLNKLETTVTIGFTKIDDFRETYEKDKEEERRKLSQRRRSDNESKKFYRREWFKLMLVVIAGVSIPLLINIFGG